MAPAAHGVRLGTAASTAVLGACVPASPEKVRQVLAFLRDCGYAGALCALERDSGVSATDYGPELGFLRSLVLAGQWDDALELVAPLEGVAGVNMRRVRCVLVRHRLYELLGRRPDTLRLLQASEDADAARDTADAIAACVRMLHCDCETREEFASLCDLVAAGYLDGRAEFAEWTVCGSRLACFEALLPLLAGDAPTQPPPQPPPPQATLAQPQPKQTQQLTQASEGRSKAPAGKGSRAPAAVDAAQPPKPAVAAAAVVTAAVTDDAVPTYRAVLTVEDDQPIRAVSFSPSGSLFAVGANSRTLRICSTAHGASAAVGPAAVLVKRNKHHRGSIYCVAWSPDSGLVATGSNDKIVRILGFDPTSQRAQGDPFDLVGHDGTVRDVAFCLGPGGGHAVVSGGAGDCALRLFDPITASCVGILRGHSHHVHGIRPLSPWHAAQLAGASIASVSADGTLRLWDVRMRDCAATVRVSEGTSDATGLTSLSVDPVSINKIAAAKASGGVSVVDLAMRRVMTEFSPHADECRSVAHSPDGKWIVTGGYDATVRLTRVEGIPRTAIVGYHGDRVTQCAWHPSLPALLSAGADKVVKYWEVDAVDDV